MGKMTDALRKARLLKEQKEGKGPAPAEPEDFAAAPPGPETKQAEAIPTEAPKKGSPVAEAPPAEPEAVEAGPAPPPVAAAPETEKKPFLPEVEGKRPEPAGAEVALPEPAPEAAVEKEPTPEASTVLPEVEVQPQPLTVEVPERASVLPELEPTPVETGIPYLSAHHHKDGQTADEFRALKNQLLAEGSPARVILVTSCVPDEGKTTLAVNLAISFANSYGEKVVLVDGNVVRPKIGEILSLPEDGLIQVIRGHLAPEDAVVKTDIPGLWALSAGRSDGRDEGLLDSRSVVEMLSLLRRRFTRVVMELPCARDAAEGLALLERGDVVLIPVMQSRTRRRRLRRFLTKAASRGAGKLHCVFIKA